MPIVYSLDWTYEREIKQVKFIDKDVFSSELYADDSLGFEVGKIANHSLKASSSLNKRYNPEYGRLNTFIGGGGWCARETNTKQYLQVDLTEVHKITNIVMQGKYAGPVEIQGWVTKFSVTYSYDGIAWSQHMEEGIGVIVRFSKFLMTGQRDCWQ